MSNKINDIIESLRERQKTAEAEFIQGLKAVPVVEEVKEASFEEIPEVPEVPEVTEVTETEVAEDLEKQAELEKIAEAEDMGKIMAHAFWDELVKIAQTVSPDETEEAEEAEENFETEITPEVKAIIDQIKNTLN